MTPPRELLDAWVGENGLWERLRAPCHIYVVFTPFWLHPSVRRGFLAPRPPQG